MPYDRRNPADWALEAQRQEKARTAQIYADLLRAEQAVAAERRAAQDNHHQETWTSMTARSEESWPARDRRRAQEAAEWAVKSGWAVAVPDEPATADPGDFIAYLSQLGTTPADDTNTTDPKDV